MLALVKTPLIEIRGETIPEALIAYLKRKFGCVELVDDDESSIPFEESEWYQNIIATTTPAESLKRRRERAGMTQKALAASIGVASTCISDMEHGRRPIGKGTAKKLGKAMKCSPSSFYW